MADNDSIGRFVITILRNARKTGAVSSAQRTGGGAFLLFWGCAAAPCALLFAGTAHGITFNKDLAPVVYEHCTVCHHQGGSGPFPLMSYEDVAKHAAQIVTVTGSRYMPPWPPERGYGKFAGDRSLSPEQIQMFGDWVKQGKARGEEADLPVAPRYSSEWQMGPPDLILKMPKPYQLRASGSDVFRNFVIPSGVKETHWVRGFELRMNNPRAVHHANVVLDRSGRLRLRDGEDGQPGFPGMDVITEAGDRFEPDSHFLFWKPATVVRPEPDDMAWRLDANTDLVANLHLQPTGKEEEVEAEMGIYFAKQEPTKLPMLVQLENDGALRIPAGAKDFAVTDGLTLPVDVKVLGIYPHAHYLGKLIEAWAVLPDGKKEWLIRITDWDINWQATYDYEKPLNLPKGTRLHMRISYDNSAGNPRNPNKPLRLVVAGNRAEDEMAHVWLQLLAEPGPGGEDGRMAIQEAVMRRRLEKYPGDFLAHYNLGAVLQMRGKLDEAAKAYRLALRSEPKNVTAHNSLGAVLLMQGDNSGAIDELRETLRLDPRYVNAKYNLGRALAISGDLVSARKEYEEVVAERPDDADALAGLGTLDFKLRDYRQALTHLREAARLDGSNADTLANLGTVLAITGDLRGAKDAFEKALLVDPEHAAAKANLARVEQELAR